MSDVIFLYENDPRVGRIENGVTHWPSQDIAGGNFYPGKPIKSTQRIFGSACFYVIPHDWEPREVKFGKSKSAKAKHAKD